MNSIFIVVFSLIGLFYISIYKYVNKVSLVPRFIKLVFKRQYKNNPVRRGKKDYQVSNYRRNEASETDEDGIDELILSGIYLYENKNYFLAIDTFDSALNMIFKMSTQFDVREYKILAYLGKIFMDLSIFLMGKTYFEIAINHAAEHRNQEIEADLLYEYSEVLHKHYIHGKSVETLEKCQELCEEIEYHEKLVHVYMKLGKYCSFAKKEVKAENYYEMAEELLGSSTHPLLANVYFYKAEAFHIWDKHKDVIDHLSIYAELSPVDDQDEKNFHYFSMLGEALDVIGQKEKSIENFDKAIAIWQGANKDLSKLDFILRLGEKSADNDDFDKAVFYYEKFIEICEEIGEAVPSFFLSDLEICREILAET